uniref:CHK kinase-like domain-containing protein n=1 Tax=Graphocephala atropunctata TaxID=36148 RepID=A0A1B6LUW8_9HEMI
MEEPNVPEWLTTDFLKCCLESDEGNKGGVAVTGYDVTSGVPPGNNYGSTILRVKITYKKTLDSSDHSISLIIKAPLVVGGIVEQFGDVLKEAYEKEPKYYELIDKSYKLIKHDVVPKHYKSPNPLCVVLEDLTTSGYVMVDRHKLLDFDHCQLYIKASAKLHALTIALYKTHPDIIQSIVKESPSSAEKSETIFKNLIPNLFKCMAAYLEDKNCKEFSDIFQDASKNENFYDVYKETEKTESKLTAVIQGDPWCTNMMFKYGNSGEVVGVKLFDFQNLKFATPVRELVTFVWVSAHPQVRENRLHDLYQLYCDSLNDTFEQLGCSERLSMEDLKAEILALSPLVLVTVCVLAPFCLADKPLDISEFFAPYDPEVPIKESLHYKLYQGITFNKYYPQIFDAVAKEGVFDYVKQKMEQVTKN